MLFRERGLLDQMADVKAGVSGSSLGLFVGMQSEELRRAAEEYRVKEEEHLFLQMKVGGRVHSLEAALTGYVGGEQLDAPYFSAPSE